MMPMTFDPVFGWVASPIIAVAIVALTVATAVVSLKRTPTDATTMGWARRILIAVMSAAIVMTPSVTRSTDSRAVNATDVFIAVDVTGSMEVQDARYGSDQAISRLDAARMAVEDIVDLYPDASFAAVSFGASGTLDVPLTPDSHAIDNWAQTLRPEPTSTSGGSNLDKAIDALLPVMGDTADQHPDDTIVLYYISDGEQTGTRTRRTFSSLRQYVDGAVAIGVGSAEGGTVPTVGDDGTVHTDQPVNDPATGQPGVSTMDETNLRNIADELSGGYTHVDADRTIGEQDARDSSGDWRMTHTAKPRRQLEPVVWPLAIVVALLLAWEAVDWARTSRRLL